MKIPILLLLLACYLFACNNESDTKTGTDTTKVQPSGIIDTSVLKKDSSGHSDLVPADSSLLDTSRSILKALKARDFDKLSTYIDPSTGLHFCPYFYTDTSENQVLTPYQLKMAAQKSSVLLWGSFDGTGDPIKMNIRQYFNRFVYNKDFLKAPQVKIDKFVPNPNSASAVHKQYMGLTYTHFRFPGFEKKYEGMDWQSLELVFKQINGKIYLVAIIHDEWTI